MEYARGIPTAGQSNLNITGAPQGFKPARENLLEAIVVANGCDARAIHGESQSGQGRAIEGETANEFSGDVLGIGSAAAVAEKKQLVSVFQSVEQDLADLGD